MAEWNDKALDKERNRLQLLADTCEKFGEADGKTAAAAQLRAVEQEIAERGGNGGGGEEQQQAEDGEANQQEG